MIDRLYRRANRARLTTGRRNPTLVALLLAFPAHVNDARIWRGQPSNLIHGLTIAEFATTCGTLHTLPIGKWTGPPHFLIGNARNSKQSAAQHRHSQPTSTARSSAHAGATRVVENIIDISGDISDGYREAPRARREDLQARQAET